MDFFNSDVEFKTKSMNVTDDDGATDSINVLLPNYCPYERRNTEYRFIKNAYFDSIVYKVHDNYSVMNTQLRSVQGLRLICVFECVTCHKFSSIEYRSEKYENNFIPIDYQINDEVRDIDVPFSKEEQDTINEFAPGFLKIYIQSSLAEINGYDEIFPIAYRKALEMLVKNTLIKIYGYDKEKVLKAELGNNNQTLLSKMEEVGNSAIVATWIANDYVHLVKKNPSLYTPDAKELKKRIVNFVRTICTWKTAKYDEEYIEDSKKKH